jgi:predicted DNA-binding transcriptional regulator AlpA
MTVSSSPRTVDPSPASPRQKEWLTVLDIAEWLDIKVSAVYWMNASGTGPPRHRLGGKALRYRRRDVEEWLASNRLESGQASRD